MHRRASEELERFLYIALIRVAGPHDEDDAVGNFGEYGRVAAAEHRRQIQHDKGEPLPKLFNEGGERLRPQQPGGV